MNIILNYCHVINRLSSRLKREILLLKEFIRFLQLLKMSCRDITYLIGRYYGILNRSLPVFRSGFPEQAVMVKDLKCVSLDFVYDAHFREFCDTPGKTFGCQAQKPCIFT